MITMFGRHPVKDFDAWFSAVKPMFNDSERNAQTGIVSTRVYRPIDGGVVVMHTFNDQETAQKYEALLQSAEIQALLEGFGALPMTIEMAEEVAL